MIKILGSRGYTWVVRKAMETADVAMAPVVPVAEENSGQSPISKLQAYFDTVSQPYFNHVTFRDPQDQT